MPGLSLMGRVAAGNGGYASSGASQAGPSASATQIAFGPGYSQEANQGSGCLAAFTPNDPFGISVWWAIGAVVVLAAIRHSLPS